MNNSTIVIESLVLAATLASVIFSFGVVWRVEKELDISFKFFLTAIIFFLASEILGIFTFEKNNFLILAAGVLRALFAVFFLAGIFTMRDLLRRMDGEK